MKGPPDHEVAIIGSGFGGLGMAVRLKRSGVTSLVILEKAGEVGGTWRDNTPLDLRLPQLVHHRRRPEYEQLADLHVQLPPGATTFRRPGLRDGVT